MILDVWVGTKDYLSSLNAELTRKVHDLETNPVRTLTFRTQSVEKYRSSSFASDGAKARRDSRVETSTLAERRIEAPTVSSAVAISAL